MCKRERGESREGERGGEERVVFYNVMLEVAHQRVPYFHTVFTQNNLETRITSILPRAIIKSPH